MPAAGKAWLLTLLVLPAFVGLGGCGKSTPVTGLVVAIEYGGDVARIAVSGAAETSGRRFGPWSVTSDQLASGGTVGFLFDASDAGAAMICAQTFDSSNADNGFDCQLFDVVAGQVNDGTITFAGASRLSAAGSALGSASAAATVDLPARSRR